MRSVACAERFEKKAPIRSPSSTSTCQCGGVALAREINNVPEIGGTRLILLAGFGAQGMANLSRQLENLGPREPFKAQRNDSPA